MARICKILVVEDNDGIRELLHTLFDDEGYEFSMASSGSEMRVALARGTIDVALIDVTLPRGEDGFSLAEIARAHGAAVILLTGDTRRFDSVKDSGYPYLLKPFRIDRLLALINEVLDERGNCAVGHSRSGAG